MEAHERDALREVSARLLAAAEEHGGPMTFLFSSVREGHGTSTVASGAAELLAESGRRTVLATVASARTETVVAGALSLEEVPEAGQGFAFGDPPLARLRVPGDYMKLPLAARDPKSWLSGFEIMIIDAPVLKEFLTRRWVPQVDGVVLVVDGEKAGVRNVVEAREDIRGLGGALTGVVINRFRSPLPRFLERRFVHG